jgi:predicted MFS family arabinose efflux permease
MAPVLAAFQGGTAVGPALGGALIEKIGLSSTYASVGGLFAMITAANHLFLKETLLSSKPTLDVVVSTKRSEGLLSGVIVSFKTAYLKWKDLITTPALRNATILNAAYWTAFAGTQMTLLPLYMVGPHLNFGATEIGMTFAYMSVVSVMASQPVAYFADRQGKIRTIIGGCGLMSASMALVPQAAGFEDLLIVLLPFALGSTALSSAPTALVTNLTSQCDRSQALAMLRTSGDVGHLIGAFSAGTYDAT